ncbi:hypothetical protein CHUAL_005130 [Chamberlinius hualienensis]
MLTSILIFVLTVVNCGSAQTTKCSELSKESVGPIPSAAVTTFVINSPYNYIFGSPRFQCGAKAFTFPKKKETGYDAFAILLKGTQAETYKCTIAGDSKSVEAVQCDTGEKFVWNVGKIFIGLNGTGYCFFSCKGDNITDFGCASNNVPTFYEEMKSYVDGLKNIQGASDIKESNKACYGSASCSVFT